MKANELRLGNYYMFQGMRHSCSYHDIANLAKEEQRGQDSSSSCYQPIPLTEEWLEKFGFEYFTKPIGQSKLIYEDYRLGNFVVIVKPKFNEIEYAPNRYDIDERSHIHPNIQYVHQLQNLYFALTGTELEIKEQL